MPQTQSKLFTLWAVLTSLSLFIIVGCTKIEIKKPVIEDNNNSVDCKSVQDANGIFTSIPNLDFEVWSFSDSKKYEEPDPNCFWTTPNKTKDIIPAFFVGVTKVGGDSAYSGKYAAMLKTGKWGTILAAATIASGTFAPNLSNPLSSIKFGKPFKKKPKKVTGYYMYFPVGGDSCGMYCFVTKTKTVGTKKVLDTLGFTRIVSTETVPAYRQFQMELVYDSDETPDNVVIYFASSEGGKDLKGQVGSTLFVDEVKVEY
jgi:hypothetical protein